MQKNSIVVAVLGFIAGAAIYSLGGAQEACPARGPLCPDKHALTGVDNKVASSDSKIKCSFRKKECPTNSECHETTDWAIKQTKCGQEPGAKGKCCIATTVPVDRYSMECWCTAVANGLIESGCKTDKVLAQNIARADSFETGHCK